MSRGSVGGDIRVPYLSLGVIASQLLPHSGTFSPFIPAIPVIPAIPLHYAHNTHRRLGTFPTYQFDVAIVTVTPSVTISGELRPNYRKGPRITVMGFLLLVRVVMVTAMFILAAGALVCRFGKDISQKHQH
nr:hypothetical protein CFP56_36355 [Quercus suber]